MEWEGGNGALQRPVREHGAMDPKVGLCSRCINARVVLSGRGSRFYLCELASRDPRFRKYPALPVVRCAGFVEVGEDDGQR